jgi:hypothetical protein
MSLIPSHTHDLHLKCMKGENKAYEVYQKPQQANCFKKLFRSQLIKQKFKQTRLQTNNNNSNQAFYSQASWGRLEIKTHEPTGTKQERKRRRK